MLTPRPILLTQTLIAVGVAIQSLEILAQRRVFSTDGLYNWDVLSTTARFTTVDPLGVILGYAFRYETFVAMALVQLAVAIAVLSGQFSAWSLTLCGLLFSGHLLFVFRNHYGLDGSDQMMLLVLAGLLAFHVHPTYKSQLIVSAFLTGQLVLSYLTAGIAKAISPVWRSGAAIQGILRTRSYGSRRLARFFLDHKSCARVMCWSVIIYECSGPVLAFVHPSLGVGFLVVGVLFHLSISISMGLNIFFWSFISTYPVAYWCMQRFSLLGA
jgi:hypothetical protein